MIRTPHARSTVPIFALAIAFNAVTPTRAHAGPALPDEAAVRAASLHATYRDLSRFRWLAEPMVASSQPGLWISLDPVTRRPVVPSLEQRQAAAAALQAAGQPGGALSAADRDAPLPVQRIPGGGELIHLNGRHIVYEVARRNASGRFTTSCTSDSASTARVLSSPPPAVRHAEER